MRKNDDHTVGKIEIDGFETEYIRFGEGKKAFVILPGLSVLSISFNAAAIAKRYEIFREDFTVYVIDRRSDPPERYTVYDMADDAAKTMKALGLSRAYIFGASQGGMIAQILAIKYPELVEKIALGSSACRVGKERCSVIEQWVELAKKKQDFTLFDSIMKALLTPEKYEKYRIPFMEMCLATVSEKDVERFAVLGEGTLGFDVYDQLAEVKLPVLATGAENDAVLGADAAREIAEAMKDNPDFELYIYSSYGHTAYDDAPDYPRRLYDFFMK